MGENTGNNNQLPHYPQSFDVVSIDVVSQVGSKCFDDDGRLKRTGTVWTASAHIITAVIGSGVLSLAWAIAQLGWVAGPVVMILFSFVTYYTSSLLSACYRSGDPVTGKRNYTYMDAIQANLGGFKVKLCGLVQYLNLFGVAIGYTIASSISMMAIKRSNCFHSSGGKDPCHMNSNIYMICFGIAEIIFSQIPDFDQLWWLSILAAVMSFTYSTIGLGLGIGKVAENRKIGGSLTGVSIGTVTETQKVWRSFQALGDIAFAYSYSMILIEIQDTVKAPPSEAKTMKKATLISVVVTTVFYMMCGCFGYASFGDMAPGNLLTGFGFYNPYWLIDIANAAIVIHLVGAYQVYCQPLFAFIEKQASSRYPNSKFITKEIDIPIPGFGSYKLNFFRLVWRTIFVIITTVISMLLPFFNDVVGLLGAFGFCLAASLMSFLAGRLAGKEGAFFFQESKHAVGKLAQKINNTKKVEAPSSLSAEQLEAQADVLPEVLRHSLPSKLFTQHQSLSASSSSSISTSKWALHSDPNNALSASPDVLNPLRAYLSLPQVTFGPKRWELPKSENSVSASTANELRQDRHPPLNPEKLKAAAEGLQQIGKAFAVATAIIFGGAALAFGMAASKLDMHNINDFKTRGRDLVEPKLENVKEKLVPIRAWVQEMSRKWHLENHEDVKQKPLIRELSKVWGAKSSS